jgi:hypothetical protein
MIQGINPYTISNIRFKRGFRIGKHPIWLKLMHQKNPIRAFFGSYQRVIYDGYYPAVVNIYGSDGSLLKQIRCETNDSAKQMCDDLNTQLADFVETTKNLTSD